MPHPWKRRVLPILRLLLGLVMLYAALPKLFTWENLSWSSFEWSQLPPPLDYSPFARSVYNYKALPVPLVNLAAMWIVALETLCALCLLAGYWLRAAALLLAVVQTAFLAGMVQAIIRGLDIDCGCFVGIDTRVGVLTLARDSLFLIGFVAVYLLSEPPSVCSEEEAMSAL
jgi:uncharacterized membrane protein YphA (DoxX/SURF4 family)